MLGAFPLPSLGGAVRSLALPSAPAFLAGVPLSWASRLPRTFLGLPPSASARLLLGFLFPPLVPLPPPFSLLLSRLSLGSPFLAHLKSYQPLHFSMRPGTAAPSLQCVGKPQWSGYLTYGTAHLATRPPPPALMDGPQMIMPGFGLMDRAVWLCADVQVVVTVVPLQPLPLPRIMTAKIMLSLSPHPFFAHYAPVLLDHCPLVGKHLSKSLYQSRRRTLSDKSSRISRPQQMYFVFLLSVPSVALLFPSLVIGLVLHRCPI